MLTLKKKQKKTSFKINKLIPITSTTKLFYKTPSDNSKARKSTFEVQR